MILNTTPWSVPLTMPGPIHEATPFPIPDLPPHYSHDIFDKLCEMSIATLTKLVNGAAMEHAHIAELIKREYERKCATEGRRVESFDYYRLEAWRELNIKYEHMSTRARG